MSVPQELINVYDNQFFGGLEDGRSYPGGWVGGLYQSTFSPSQQLTEGAFAQLSPADQRALIDGKAGPQYANNVASSGFYSSGSRNDRAGTGPLGGMATGLGVLGAPEERSQSYDYGKYVNDQNAPSIFPEMFQVPSEQQSQPPPPWWSSPHVTLKQAANGQVYGRQPRGWVNTATDEVTPWTTIAGGYDGPTPEQPLTEQAFNAQWGAGGGQDDGAAVLPPPAGTYQAYVGQYGAQYPGVFGAPATTTPAVPASAPVSGGPPAGSQPPGPAPAGYHWVWRG